MHGIWALLTRSLRLDARDRWSHGIRGLALILGYYALWNAQQHSRWFGAPGLRFFLFVVMANAWLILLAGISYFSATITEEKEENTLGLILMTGLSPLGLLLGKAGGRMVQAALLVLLQLPLAMLAITLGGITLAKVLAAMTALIALLFFVGNLALLCSVLCRTTRSAALAMIVCSVLYGVAAWFVEVMRWYYARAGGGSRFWSSLCELHVFRRIVFLFESSAQPAMISACEIVFFAGGTICFLLSWALFGWAVQQPDTVPASRAWWMARHQKSRWVNPGRVWETALVWKELYFTLGGWQQLLMKTAGYVLLVMVIALTNWLIDVGRNWRFTEELSVVCLSLAMALEGAVLSSRVFSEEIRHQTWSALALTPLSLREILQLKWATVFIGLLPVATVDFLMVTMTRHGGRMLWESLDHPLFYGIVAMFVTCAHFAAVFSLYVRWGAVPLGAGVVWGAFILMMMIGEPGMGKNDAAAFSLVGSALACLVCQGWIYHRMDELASQ